MTSFVHELILARGQAMRSAVAMIEEEERTTWAQVITRTNILAQQLREVGVVPETVVGVCCERATQMIVCMIAVMRAGGVYLPLDPVYPRDRLHFMAKDSGAKFILVDRVTESLFSGFPGPNLLRFFEPEEQTVRHSSDAPLLSPANIAYIIYTSGSTGLPKGVAIPHSALLNLARAQELLFALTSADVVLQFASFGFDASLWEIMMAMTAGSTLVLGPRTTMVPGPKLHELIRKHHVTVGTFSPSILAMLTSEIDSLETIIVGGETCGADLVDRWATGRRFFNAYGPTEATICATAFQCVAKTPVSIGRPLPNIRVHILDAHFEPVPLGQTGQICIGGVGVSRGYLNRSDLTAGCFIPDPWSDIPGQRLYCTGDLGYYLSDGCLQFAGRLDHQLKVRGVRIEPGEIENALRGVAWVRNAVIMKGKAGERETEVLIAYVATENASPNKDVLRQFLLKTLPESMIPTDFIFMKDLPLTKHGKIDREALSTLPTVHRPGDGFDSKRTRTEETICEIWSNVLGVGEISANSNFFDLGGHSLPANQIIARLQELFNVDIALPQIFQTPTVASLGSWIDRERLTSLKDHSASQKQVAAGTKRSTTKTTPSVLVEFHAEGSKPPLFLVHPGGGDVFCYVELAKHLGVDQPVYCFRCVDEDNQTDASIPAMARQYIEVLRELDRNGPLLLGGWSLGGVIAFEIACQLQQKGENTDLLLLLDSAVPVPCNQIDESLIFFEFIRDIERIYQTGPLTSLGLEDFNNPEKLQLLHETIETVGMSHRIGEIHDLEKAFRRFRINYVAAHRYLPRSYEGTIVLLRGADQDNVDCHDSSLGWNSFTRANMSCRSVPGDHYTMMQSPFAQTLAESITEYLARFEHVAAAEHA